MFPLDTLTHMDLLRGEGWRQMLVQSCEAEGPTAENNEVTRAYNALAYLAKSYAGLTREYAMDCLLQIRQDRAGVSSTVQNLALRHGWKP